MPLDKIVYLGPDMTATLREGVEHTVHIDSAGIGKAVVTYFCRFDVAATLVKNMLIHPEYTWLRRDEAVITRGEGYVADVKITFKGVDPDAGGGSMGEGENGEVVVYSVEDVVDTEPIESHPDFVNFAGKWNDSDSWLNGAQFDETGRFLGFKPALDDGSPNPKGGLKSYLSPGVIYSRTRTIPRVILAALAVDLNAVGKIDTPPASPILPRVSAGRNWLKLGAPVESVGEGARIVERWKLSGPGGWDPDVYKQA